VAFHKTVIPGRDPWFDRLTTLSEVEGESRRFAEHQIILDPGSHPALRDLAGMTEWCTVPKTVDIVFQEQAIPLFSYTQVLENVKKVTPTPRDPIQTKKLASPQEDASFWGCLHVRLFPREFPD
jgi:hypothetical protein